MPGACGSRSGSENRGWLMHAHIPYLLEWTLRLQLLSDLERCSVYSRAATIQGLHTHTLLSTYYYSASVASQVDEGFCFDGIMCGHHVNKTVDSAEGSRDCWATSRVTFRLNSVSNVLFFSTMAAAIPSPLHCVFALSVVVTVPLDDYECHSIWRLFWEWLLFLFAECGINSRAASKQGAAPIGANMIWHACIHAHTMHRTTCENTCIYVCTHNSTVVFFCVYVHVCVCMCMYVHVCVCCGAFSAVTQPYGKTAMEDDCLEVLSWWLWEISVCPLVWNRPHFYVPVLDANDQSVVLAIWKPLALLWNSW